MVGDWLVEDEKKRTAAARPRLCCVKLELVVGWMVGWMLGCLIGWSVGRLVGWSVGRLVKVEKKRTSAARLRLCCVELEVGGWYGSVENAAARPRLCWSNSRSRKETDAARPRLCCVELEVLS